MSGPTIVVLAVVAALIAGWCFGTYEARKDRDGPH